MALLEFFCIKDSAIDASGLDNVISVRLLICLTLVRTYSRNSCTAMMYPTNAARAMVTTRGENISIRWDRNMMDMESIICCIGGGVRRVSYGSSSDDAFV